MQYARVTAAEQPWLEPRHVRDEQMPVSVDAKTAGTRERRGISPHTLVTMTWSKAGFEGTYAQCCHAAAAVSIGAAKPGHDVSAGTAAIRQMLQKQKNRRPNVTVVSEKHHPQTSFADRGQRQWSFLRPSLAMRSAGCAFCSFEKRARRWVNIGVRNWSLDGRRETRLIRVQKKPD